jgi:hypothetical protein
MYCITVLPQRKPTGKNSFAIQEIENVFHVSTEKKKEKK